MTGDHSLRPVLGIDIGGSGIKGALVDLADGRLVSERLRIPTPTPSSPELVIDAVGEIAETFRPQLSSGHITGVTFPGVIIDERVETAANMDKAWIGLDLSALARERIGLAVSPINDADAAAIAEAEYGAARGVKGVVLVLTIGTGIGSGIVVDGVLVPNSELGHLLIDGVQAEKIFSDAARKREEMSWHNWALGFNRDLEYVEGLVWPSLIVIGGGVARKQDRFIPYLDARTPIEVAALGNEAGIVGAALSASRKFQRNLL